MSKSPKAEDRGYIKGIKNDGDERSRLQRLESSTNCERCDCDKILNASCKNLTVQTGDTQMCDLLAS